MPDQLLFPVFNAFRERGFQLGISEYKAALDAVRQGFHMENPERLRRLLCLLWAKSRDDEALLNRLFDEMVAPLFTGPDESGGKGRGDDLTDRAAADGQQRAGSDIFLEQEARKVKAGETYGGMRLSSPGRPDGDRPRFRMTPRPPVRMRRAARAFHRYSRPVCAGVSGELDVPATIERICKEHYLVRPVFTPRRINRAGLLVLVDYGGSMTPFGMGVEPLLEALEKQARLHCPRIYYFHDCPGGYLFETPGPAKPVALDEVLALPSAGLGILILSDAGAARGDYDGERIRQTTGVLKRLKNLSPRLVWLNPVPPARWKRASAGEISKIIPMFPLTREGMEDAVKVLRGLPPNSGKGV